VPNLLWTTVFASHWTSPGDLKNELTSEGFNMALWPPGPGMSSDQIVNFTGYVNAVSFYGSAIGGWTNEIPSSVSPTGYQRALLVWAEDWVSGTSIAVSAVTNLNPPAQDVSGYTAVNAEQLFYINFTFYAYGFPNGSPPASGQEVSWYYWQYGTNYNPNWFWGVYLWWRNYLKSYGLTYYAWYWWFWHWYYTEFWYYWGTSFPYA